MPTHERTIAILASGSGSTAEAIIHATQEGSLSAEVGLVITNKPDAGVLERVRRLNKEYGLSIEDMVIDSKGKYQAGNVGRGQTLSESEAICKAISDRGIAHVALLGYMRIVRGDLMDEYGWKPEYTSSYQARMTNTHPGPLPETADTYGLGTSEKVLALGMLQSRHTFHLVAAGIDTGPILAEHPVDVLEGDTAEDLFMRVQGTEKARLALALDAFLCEQGEYFGNPRD